MKQAGSFLFPRPALWLAAVFALLGLGLLAGCAPERKAPAVQPGQFSQPRQPVMHPVAPKAEPTAPSANRKEVRIGVLLPLSGPSAPLGHALRDAAELGMFDKYGSMPDNQKPTQVILLPKDTEGTAKGADLAAKAALEEGATLFIGPLFSEEVKAVKPLAKKAGVPVLSFSNNPDVAGDGVYLFGFLPQQQVHRVAATAYARNLEHIGALVPANAYGEMVAKALQEAAIYDGKTLVGIEYYPPAGPDADVEIQKLLQTDAQGKKPEIDAVLIAEGGERLIQIVERLKVFGLSNENTQLLGTGLWDDPALLAHPALKGGWFAGSPLVSVTGFEKRFQGQYGYRPPRLASLAYDAVALTVTLAVMATDAHFPETALTNAQGFVGPANGVFRLRPDGQIERSLSVIELTPGGFKEISPAPRAFTGPGF